MNKIEMDFAEWFKVETWLIELKVILECEALIQPPDVSGVYLKRAKEIEEFLNKR